MWNSDMSKSKDTEKTVPNAGKPESRQNPASYRDNTVRPVEVKTIKVKKGIWRIYDATDGLPGLPMRLLQDRYGYLWIGTDVGLCRYDGTEFITYTIADGSVDNYVNYVTALCQDNQGRIWVGTARAISCFDGSIM